jgi:hypothetical protein
MDKRVSRPVKKSDRLCSYNPSLDGIDRENHDGNDIRPRAVELASLNVHRKIKEFRGFFARTRFRHNRRAPIYFRVRLG